MCEGWLVELSWMEFSSRAIIIAGDPPIRKGIKGRVHNSVFSIADLLLLNLIITLLETLCNGLVFGYE